MKEPQKTAYFYTEHLRESESALPKARSIAEWELRSLGMPPTAGTQDAAMEGNSAELLGAGGWSIAFSAAREAFTTSTICWTSDGGIDIVVWAADKPFEDPTDKAVVKTWLI